MSDSISLAIIGFISSAFGVVVGAVVSLYINRKKPLVDLSESELKQAEIEKLRNDITRDLLQQAADDRKQDAAERAKLQAENAAERARMQEEIDTLNRKFNLVMSWARAFHAGASENAKYIKERYNDIPPYEPPQKFPTGPLGAV